MYTTMATQPNVFYKDDVCTVYNNDFRSIIDNLTFNYIVTDPPYNVGYDYPDYNDSMTSEEYIQLLSPLNKYKIVMIHYAEDFCGDVGEAMGRPSRCVTWAYSSNLPRQSRMLAWFGCKPDFNKVKQPYKNPEDARIKKLIAAGSAGSRIYDWWSDIQLVKNVSKDKIAGFTNQIPIPLLERIILITTQPGDTILDPFFGSGSLYFACKNTGRKCIGIEQSPKHLDCFKQRLAKQAAMSSVPPGAPVVSSVPA
jgi:DNA modification methylase